MSTKIEYISSDMQISDVILKNPRIMVMLEQFGIKLALNEKTIVEVCKENNISSEVFLLVANMFRGIKYNSSYNFTAADVNLIVTYLKTSHTYFLNEKIPKIYSLIKQMNALNSSPEILLVENFFNEYLKEVREHFDYENNIVFPFVTGLFNLSAKENIALKEQRYTVHDYKEHHTDVEEKLTDLKNLLIKYLPVKDDQQVRRELLFSLFDFEDDLSVHAKIEEFILIPLAEKREKEMLQAK